MRTLEGARASSLRRRRASAFSSARRAVSVTAAIAAVAGPPFVANRSRVSSRSTLFLSVVRARWRPIDCGGGSGAGLGFLVAAFGLVRRGGRAACWAALSRALLCITASAMSNTIAFDGLSGAVGATACWLLFVCGFFFFFALGAAAAAAAAAAATWASGGGGGGDCC